MRKAEAMVAALLAFGVLALLVAPLSTPYWWDAGAVYAPGAKWLLDHGFDARPKVFPDDLSRGHVPLYYLLLAGAFRLAGAGPWAGHALAFGFAWAAALATYALGRELYGRAAGAVAASILVAAPLFLTMSSEALPEVPLTALTAATFYAFARGKIVACAALGTVLVLVKETGVACPVALACALTIHAALARKKLRHEAARIALVLAPAGVLAAFFLYQKAATGWFVTPNHAALFGEPHSLAAQIWRVARSIVVDDGRVVAVLIAGALGLCYRTATATGHPRAAARDTVVCIGSGTVLVALGMHAAFNLLFFTKSFYLERYTLPVQVGAVVVLGGALAPRQCDLPQRLVGLVAAAITVGTALSRREAGAGMASGETSFRYLHAVHAYSAAYRRMEREGGSPVVLTAWPMTDALREPFLGWVERPFSCIEIGDRPPGELPRFDRVVTAEGLGSHAPLVERAQAAGFRRLDREEEGGAAIEVWGP
jgi:hypothetical protein